MDDFYVRKPGRSWHLFLTWTRVPGRVVTVCERSILNPEESKTLPTGKTCESCYRLRSKARIEADAG